MYVIICREPGGRSRGWAGTVPGSAVCTPLEKHWEIRGIEKDS